MSFDYKEKSSTRTFITNITETDELEEIQHIESRLDLGEEVIFVAKQSRFKPGGSNISPDTIFVTDKRIIIRNPSVMGLRETVWVITYDKLSSITLDNGMMSSTLKIWAAGYNGEIDAIPRDKAEKMAEYIKEKIQTTRPEPSQSAAYTSIADELTKLAKLKADGAISDTEFQALKAALLSKPDDSTSHN